MVVLYVGEVLPPLEVLFSAHPTADTSSKSEAMGNNFAVLIAWKAS
jgi:hypothetical protein